MKITLPGRREDNQAAAMVLEAPLDANRQEMLDRLESERFDVVIVGGGITGCYAALDAALRGLRVALIEKDDFASGTSSKSSKMVHGGLRYIEQGNLPLVRHSLLERQRLRRNAPHIVQRLPFLFPILKRGGIMDERLALAFEALLWTYDGAGGWREGKLHKRLAHSEVMARCPTFRPEELQYGLLYYDARADDARLTLAAVRTAIFHGAVAANHAKVVEVMRTGGKITGVRVDAEGREVVIRAGVVVMATGVWLKEFTGAKPGVATPNIRPAKGVHIVVPWTKIRNDCTVTIPVPGRTRRATITRWGDVSVLGTTDEDYTGDLDDIYCTRDEMDFLIAGAESALNTSILPTDVLGSLAGSRPLVAPPGGKTLEVKRNHEIRIDEDGMITVVGGKLTTARHMAEQTVDAIAKVLGHRAPCRTENAYLLGGASFDAQASVASGGYPSHLAERYGTESRFVSEILIGDPAMAEPVVPGQPYRMAEVVYAVRHEMATTVDDVLSRRTRLRIHARDASAEAAPAIGAILQRELGLSADEVSAQVASYVASVNKEKSVLMGEEQQ